MNEKEAREIVSQDKVDYVCGHQPSDRAKGYLEAIEKAKVLENGLKRAWIHRHGHHPCCMDEFRETLAQWEKEK